MILDFGSLYQKHVYFRLLFTTAKQSAHYLIFNPMHYALCAMLLSDWRKCMGVEPTADIFCPPLDLKSRRPARTYPLPFFTLIDFLFKVNPSALSGSTTKIWVDLTDLFIWPII